MNVREAIRTTASRLRAVGIEEARAESEFLVAAALRIPRTHLILQETEVLPHETEARIGQWTARRSQRQPLAYVTGEQPFMDLSLEVTPAVLIPRPETELLVERALAWLSQTPSPLMGEGGDGGEDVESAPHPRPPPQGGRGSMRRSLLVADIGAGSGNIAIALARHPHVGQVLAVDLSPKALAVARANARRHGVQARCLWFVGDLLEPVRYFRRPLDLIAANLPYVRADELPGLEPEVRREPRLALDGGATGLEIIGRLLEPAHRRLRPGGMLLLEVGAGQAEPVEERLREADGWSRIEIFKDLAGWPRIVQAIKEESWTS